MKFASAVLLGAALGLSSVPAFAADANDAHRADSLFREARALLDRGDYAGACEKLAESQRLDPAPGTAANWGDCSERLGRLVEALSAYRTALELLPAGDRRVDPVKRQLDALDRRVPRVTIRLAPKSPSGSKVKRDAGDVSESEIGTPLAMNPGVHRFVVTAPGRQPARFSVKLVEGERREIVVEPGEEGDSEPASDVARGPKSRGSTEAHERGTDGSSRTLGLVLGGAGLVACAVGGYAVIRTNQDKDASDEAHANGNGALGSEKYDQAKRWQTIGIVAFVVGGGALITGSVLYFTAAPTEPTHARRFEIGVGGRF